MDPVANPADAAAKTTPQPLPYRQGDKPLHEYLREHARRQPDKTAFVWYGRLVSYRELDQLSDRFAARLHALQVRPGDRVALFMNNCPQYIIAHCGIQKLGAIVGPCGPLFKAMELEYQLCDLGAQVIVAADSLYPVLEAVRGKTAIREVFVTHYGDMLPSGPGPTPIDVPAELRTARSVPAGCRDLLAELADPTDPATPPAMPPAYVPDMDTVALMTYTSGTTGLPKGAMLSYRNALFKTAVTADCNGVAADEVTLSIAPLYHIAGMLFGINVTLYTGATSVLLYRFDPLAVLQAIERFRVSFWYSIAPMNVAILQLPGADRFDLSSLKVNPATSFGITLTPELAQQWADFTGGAQMYEAAYGLSESHTCDTVMPRDAVRWGAHGRVAPGVECRIIDPDSGIERPRGEMGEITLRSAGSFKGYWNKPEATAATLRDGWVHTGDMGRLDADNYLTFVGRFKEMIKVSGYSVFPEEVEGILIRHPLVAAAAVIGLPDPSKGEVVKAVIVRRDTGAALDADQLIAWCRDNMSAYKVPRVVEFRDSLPATGAGKLLRRLLK